MKILVVDDSKLVRVMATRNLTREGFEVVEASSGDEALERLEGVDAVLTDMMMPVMNGLELTRRLRALPQGERLAILLVSGEELSKDEEEQHRGSGIDDFVPKGIKPEQLKLLIEQNVTRRQSQHGDTSS